MGFAMPPHLSTTTARLSAVITIDARRERHARDHAEALVSAAGIPRRRPRRNLIKKLD
jgi:hypothetical protein